jgi:hypothetical protein
LHCEKREGLALRQAFRLFMTFFNSLFVQIDPLLPAAGR